MVRRSNSEIQKNVILCFWYDAEVNSGGHSGYFDSYPDTVPQDRVEGFSQKMLKLIKTAPLLTGLELKNPGISVLDLRGTGLEDMKLDITGGCMHTELIKAKLFEQSETYQALKSGDASFIQYKGHYDERWGTRDANYLNRMRLAYYLLYANIDDEDLVVYLFQEELKDRKSNSFQGIGNTLNVLTSIW